MGEIDQVDDAVDHGVAQRHQSVHAAEHQSIDDLLQQDIDGRSPQRCAIVGKKKPSAKEGLSDETAQNFSVVGIDVHIFGFLDKQGANDESRTRDDDRIPQAVIHVAGLRHDGKRGGG